MFFVLIGEEPLIDTKYACGLFGKDAAIFMNVIHGLFEVDEFLFIEAVGFGIEIGKEFIEFFFSLFASAVFSGDEFDGGFDSGDGKDSLDGISEAFSRRRFYFLGPGLP